MLGLGLLGTGLGFVRPAHASGSGSQSALAVQVTVVRPCVVGGSLALVDPRGASAQRDGLIRDARAALAASCAVEEPRVEVLDVHGTELAAGVPTLDIEF